ncbi:MAG TPA: sigma-54 dependent transcriptional regulator [Candidatus Saccharimonadales bacterium]|nr:sigma-54 dependent transcriptional regulator [Candidatus Saccharimonadales bacterium]
MTTETEILARAEVWVVDDEDAIRRFVAQGLQAEGYAVQTAATGGEALSLLETQTPDVLLLDLRLPDMTGLDVLARARAQHPDLAVILFTAYGDVDSAVQAMKLGAFHFANKPIHHDQLSLLISQALDSRRLQRELKALRRVHADRFPLDFVQGTAPAIQKVYEIAERVAASDTTSVLIEGESGTGKELIAQLIHHMSARRDKPFMEINCAAIPRELLESELFGYEKGAFTDARAQKLGLLELADGGTLFLDEVGEMSVPMQVKLLKVLERMTFKRVGGTRDVSVNVRILSATNQNLEQNIRTGLFREDLYFRLKVVPIHMPALRERREDIASLALHFLEQFNRAFRKNFQGISPEARRLLEDYAWPGNIRELKNLMERTVLLECGERIEAHHLQHLPSGGRGAGEGSLLGRMEQVLSAPEWPAEGVPLERWVEDLERALIAKASEAARWNQSRTAELLQLNRDKLRYRMKTYGIRPPQR